MCLYVQYRLYYKYIYIQKAGDLWVLCECHCTGSLLLLCIQLCCFVTTAVQQVFTFMKENVTSFVQFYIYKDIFEFVFYWSLIALLLIVIAFYCSC